MHEGKADEDIGAGDQVTPHILKLPVLIYHDQGLMFGYATQETEELMPMSLMLAHKLNKKMADCRRDGSIAWLRPDSKTQVCVDTVVLNG